MSGQEVTVVLKRQEADDGRLSVVVIVGGEVQEEVPCVNEEHATAIMQDIVTMMIAARDLGRHG